MNELHACSVAIAFLMLNLQSFPYLKEFSVTAIQPQDTMHTPLAQLCCGGKLFWAFVCSPTSVILVYLDCKPLGLGT